MKTLREVPVGSTVKVVKLHGEGAVKRRIMDMGITRGTQVYVRKVAPRRPHRSHRPQLRAFDPQGGRRDDRDRIKTFRGEPLIFSSSG